MTKRKGDMMTNELGNFIKEKVNRAIINTNKRKANIISELNIKTQYLYDLEHGKRTPSPDLMKKMIEVLRLNEVEQIELYDLVSESHTSRKIPADIEEYIIKNKSAKDEIRKLILKNKLKEGA